MGILGPYNGAAWGRGDTGKTGLISRPSWDALRGLRPYKRARYAPSRRGILPPQSCTSFKESRSQIVVRVFRRIDRPEEGCSTGYYCRTAPIANSCVFKHLELSHLRLVPEQSGRQIATLLVCLTPSPVTLMAVAYSDVGAEASSDLSRIDLDCSPKCAFH